MNNQNSPERDTRGLAESDDTLFSQRVNHEKEMRNIQIQAINSNLELSKKSIQDLKKLQKDTIDYINNYKQQILNKYADQVASGILDNRQAEEKAAKDVNDYILIQKRKQYAEEKELAKTNAQDLYKAKKQEFADELKAQKENLTKTQKLKQAFNVKEKAKNASEKRKNNKELKNSLKEAGFEGKELLEARASAGDKTAEFEKANLDKFEEKLNGFVNGLKQLFDNTIQTYGTYQAKINTRLQGSGSSWNGLSGTTNIEKTIKAAVGTTAYVKLQSVMDNVVTATEAGIANNIEQRAFLATISENIAATFDAFDSNLLRIIRVQQADTTAARLGMEAGLTNFLNSYFGDNSYLNSAFDIVSQNLFEAMSQLSAEEAVGVEYQIQKWLGSLYSVGFSDSAVSKISQALGYLGSGNISALSGDSTMQNLMVMAMNKANLSYGDIMTEGLTASTTNSLLKSMVEYLEEIANSDNKVVKSQYAEVFGMTVSDLEAAKNLTSSIKDIANSSMNYTSSISELYSQMSKLDDRISIAGKLQNLYDNVNYSIGTNIAANPAMYALWQITSAIEDLTGGIALPTFSVMGNMVDLNTTVTNLMRAGLVGTGTLGSIGTIISGLGSSVNPSSMLSKLGISGSKAKAVSRGGALNRRKNALNQTSSSSYIGNSSGDDYYNQTLTSANEETSKQIEQKKKEATDITLNNIHEYLLSVFDPKITAIDKMVASIAGYNFSQSKWGTDTFSGNISKEYMATTITVTETSKNNLSNRDILNDLRSTSSDILELLKKVISDSGIKIDYGLNTITGTGIPGLPE